jgi:hypothetical protein
MTFGCINYYFIFIKSKINIYMDIYNKYLKYKKKYYILKESLLTKNMIGGEYDEEYFNYLPNELIYNILNSLPIKDVDNFKFVNKRLNEICETYIQNYMSRRLYANNLNDALYLYTQPEYREIIKAFLINYLESKVNTIVETFTQLVTAAGGPISSNLLKENGGTKYEIIFRTNNSIIKISNVGMGSVMMCDIYSSIGGRRNAIRSVLIDEIKYILRTFIMDRLISMTTMNFNLTEYNYEPGNYGTLVGPSNINIII